MRKTLAGDAGDSRGAAGQERQEGLAEEEDDDVGYANRKIRTPDI